VTLDLKPLKSQYEKEKLILTLFHVRRVPCHHSMKCPRVVDGEGVQIWRVLANILNKKFESRPGNLLS
jgi:hypothetical protein